MSKPIFRMSSAGNPARILAARLLGYKETTEAKTPLLKHATRSEALAAMQVEDMDYILEKGPEICPICFERTGVKISGIHVEIEETHFILIGHLDRRLVLPEISYPLEIKSAGERSFSSFKANLFSNHYGYAAQEACYLHAEGKPGLYYVMNRSNGDSIRFTVNDIDKRISLPEFYRNVNLPVTYDAICNEHNLAVVYAQDNELPPECSYKPFDWECIYCHFKYLCPNEQQEN